MKSYSKLAAKNTTPGSQYANKDDSELLDISDAEDFLSNLSNRSRDK